LHTHNSNSHATILPPCYILESSEYVLTFSRAWTPKEAKSYNYVYEKNLNAYNCCLNNYKM